MSAIACFRHSVRCCMLAKEETVPNNRLGAACYLAGTLFPIIFLTSEPFKSNRFVRFHSFQSVIFFIIVGAWRLAEAVVPSLGRSVAGWLDLAFLALWILLMVKAYQGQTFKLPLIGGFAERHAVIANQV